MIRKKSDIALFLIALFITITSAPLAVADQINNDIKIDHNRKNHKGKDIAKAMCDGVKKANEEEGCSSRQDVMRLLASSSNASRSKGQACEMLYEKFAKVCHWE